MQGAVYQDFCYLGFGYASFWLSWISTTCKTTDSISVMAVVKKKVFFGEVTWKR